MASDQESQAAPLVGVLALQGDFEDHQAALEALDMRTQQVRTRAQLEAVDALVLPGGESTTMLKLLEVEGLWDPLGAALRRGTPTMATCAGMILLASSVEEPAQRCYGLLPITVVRNGYGRQYHSGTFSLHAATDELPSDLEGTFIRAPKVTGVHGPCEVLARRGADPVLVRKGNLLAASFHPELCVGHPVTRMFAAMVRSKVAAAKAVDQAEIPAT